MQSNSRSRRQRPSVERNHIRLVRVEFWKIFHANDLLLRVFVQTYARAMFEPRRVRRNRREGKCKVIPRHAMEALGVRGGRATTHS
jgi:hypothetical protein